jgi:hypothetical protein
MGTSWSPCASERRVGRPPRQFALGGLQHREHFFPREIVQNLRGDDQVEGPAGHLFGQRAPLDPYVPPAREAPARRGDGPLGDVHRQKLVAAVREHLRKDADGRARFQGPAEGALAKHGQGRGVLVLLVVARLEVPGIARLGVEPLEVLAPEPLAHERLSEIARRPRRTTAGSRRCWRRNSSRSRLARSSGPETAKG